jgi:DNA polymerase-3 subunit delta'
LEPQTLLDAAGGAPLAALAFADVERWSRRRQLVESYEQVLTGKTDPVRVAESWLRGDLAENLRWLISWHIDQIRLKMNSEPPRLGNPDLRPVLRRWASRLPPHALFERLDSAVRLSVLCSTTQVNAQLLLEAFLGGSAACSESDVPRTSVTGG